MKIGTVTIDGFAALAPMAGVADSAFRELCRDYGAAYSVSEMVSAKALTMNDKKSEELLTFTAYESPVAAQLFGYDPSVMGEAVKKVLPHSPLFIDINMGCPAPKIVKNGSGSVLMKDPDSAVQIVAAIKKNSPVPVTVKMRTGWDEGSKNCVEFAKRLEYAGADAITVHGRTKEQMYAPPVDSDSIKAVKKAVHIPVIGNGDIFSPEDAKRMYENTECDFIMVGRGSLGAPWIFRQINEYLATGVYTPAPETDERMAIMLRHADRICALRGEKHGMCELRKHALWYTKGLPRSAQLRNRFSTVSDRGELKALAEEVTKNCCR